LAGIYGSDPGFSDVNVVRGYFADEHTHPDYCGTVHGAWLSGQRAAAQIISHAG
jgi:monoamine oxidase